MSEQTLDAGDIVTATVTKAVPFGVLVEYADVPGLVCGVTAEPGAELRVRVDEFDVAERRFAASVV